MSSVRRAGRGKTAQHHEAVLAEAECASTPEPALPEEAAALVPPDSSHLVECPQCHTLNGRSAALCWSCEALLFAAEPRDEVKAAEVKMPEAMPPAVPVPSAVATASDAPRPGGLHLVTRGGFPTVASEVVATPDTPADALPSSDVALPVLTNLVEADVAGHGVAVEGLPAFALPESSWRRAFAAERSWPIGRWALIGFVVLITGSGLYRFRGASTRDTGSQAAPAPAAVAVPVAREPAPDPTAAPGRDDDRAPRPTGAGAPADVPTVNLPRVAAEPVRPRHEPRQKSAATAAKPRAKAGAAPGTEAAVPTGAPALPAAEPSTRHAAEMGPCTATVAALGLCSLPPPATKD